MLLWGLVAGWIPSLRLGETQRTVWLIFLTMALIKTVKLDVAGAPIQRALGVNADTLVQHLLAITAALCLLRFVSLITGSRPRRQHVFLWLGVAVTQVLLFTVARDGVPGSAEELLAAPSIEPAAVAYWLLLEAYLGTVLCVGGLVIWRVSRASPTNPLRVGLWLMCAGVALNALFAAYKAAYIVAHAAGVTLPRELVVAISDAMLPISGLLIVSGVLVPAWTVGRELAGLWLRMYALAPLWRTMRAAFPEVILKLPAADGVLATARLRLYRWMIEIRDGMLELRGYVSPDVVRRARAFLARHGVPDDEAAVIAEACWIEVALRRVRANEKPVHCPGERTWVPGGADEREEARWLARVSRAHRGSCYPVWFAESLTRRASDSPAPTP